MPNCPNKKHKQKFIKGQLENLTFVNLSHVARYSFDNSTKTADALFASSVFCSKKAQVPEPSKAHLFFPRK